MSGTAVGLQHQPYGRSTRRSADQRSSQHIDTMWANRPGGTPLRQVTRGLVIAALCVLAACGGSSHTATSSSSAARNPKYDLTFQQWSTASLTPGESTFENVTGDTYGIGTNPPKMLEYGYDLCEMYAADPSKSRADVIRDFSVANNVSLAQASQLGAAATQYLCP